LAKFDVLKNKRFLVKPGILILTGIFPGGHVAEIFIV